MSAAFDLVDHRLLLERLNKVYGITGTVLDWCASYLINRREIVQVRASRSPGSTRMCGVPQGSVLGPQIFTLFVAPLFNIIRKHSLKVQAYADDIQLYCEFESTQIQSVLLKLDSCFRDVKLWMLENMLCLNESKTETIFFSSSSDILNAVKCVKLGESSIFTSSCVRNLGFYLDNSLKLDKQVNNVIKKAYYSLKNINKLRPFLDINSTKILVQSLIFCHLDQFNSMYYGLSAQDIYRLQKAQNAAARCIMRVKYKEHITPTLQHQTSVISTL